MAKREWLMGMAGDRIIIDFQEYNPDMTKVIKVALPGPCRWDKENKWYTFPLHWDTCTGARKMSKQFNARLVIGDSLNKWALQEKERQDAIPDVQSMDLVELENVRSSYPGLWDAISSRPFQTVGAQFAARNRSCLIADQPGLGKTLQSIAAIVESGTVGPILVCAPKSAANVVWPAEIERWLGPSEKVLMLGAHLKPAERTALLNEVKFKEQLPHRIWVITSPSMVRVKAEVDEYGKYVYKNGQKILQPSTGVDLGLWAIQWSAIIVDESHQTLAGASGDKKKQSAQRVGLGALDVAENGLRIALSGTPFRGQEQYLWGQLNFLRPDLYRSRWNWIKEFFEVTQGRYGMEIGQSINRQAMYDNAKRVMIRRTKAEVAADLPEKQYCEVWLDMDAKQQKAYDDLVNKAEADLDDGTLMTMGVLSELTRLKQLAGSYGNIVNGEFKPAMPSNKFDWLVEFLDERGIEKNLDKSAPKVLVASQFSQLIDLFARELDKLGIKVYKITGATSGRDREFIVSQWQHNKDDEFRVLLMTTTAGGTGLTLDAFCDDLVELDETWNPADSEQLEDRIHRLSRIHQVTIWKPRSNGTLEEGIAKSNTARDASIKGIIDGSRGVEYTKKIMRGDAF